MTWIRKGPPPHTCEKPRITRLSAAAGDVWVCDHPGCPEQYVVEHYDDQREGSWSAFRRLAPHERVEH
jgi:hypothetical protein